jgi:hypothetical protein
MEAASFSEMEVNICQSTLWSYRRIGSSSDFMLPASKYHNTAHFGLKCNQDHVLSYIYTAWEQYTVSACT